MPVDWNERMRVLRFRVRATVRSSAANRQITPGRFLPTAEGLGLGHGRLLRAAILYADLRGFSAMVVGTPPPSSLLVLDVFVSEFARIASDHGGEVVDTAGDRILATFWRPRANVEVQPIHDAVTCALWMQTAMKEGIAPELASGGYPALACGIGIDYGPVVVARVGIRNRNKLVFLGPPGVLAAKLEDWAQPGETLMTPAVYDRRPGFLQPGRWPITVYESDGRPSYYGVQGGFAL